MPDTKISILGCGQMGLACAGILQDAAAVLGSSADGGWLSIWAHEPEEAAQLQKNRTSPRLDGVRLADGVRVTSDLHEAVTGAEIVVSAIPVQFTRGVWQRLTGSIADNPGVVTVSKGIEVGTKLTPTRIIQDAIGSPIKGGLCVLSGPAIAPELAKRLPATMLAASENTALAERVQQLFSTKQLRVYTGSDVVGVEIAGALKNVIALAAGILDGLEMGYNAKSALLARGLAELVRIGSAMGAKPETFFGVAGVGDLATTCFCPMGRNRSFGEALVRGESLEAFTKRTGSVVEGAATVQAAVALADDLKVDMPIARGVHAVLYGGMDPNQVIRELMARELKEERVG